LVDSALRAREADDRPIRVGLVGSVFMAQGLCKQIANSVPGVRGAAVYGRNVEKAAAIVRYSGFADAPIASSDSAFEARVASGKPAVTDDPLLLTRSEQIDVLVELTRSVEFGAQVALDAFAHGKPVVLMNAELDATIGPILHARAREHGV